MATDVSSLVRVLSGYREDRMVGNEADGGNYTAPITRDLLGGGFGSGNKNESYELDLDMEVPSGWEKRLDLKSGKVYLQRCNSSTSPLSSNLSYQRNNQTNQTVVTKLQDLNCPPSPSSRVTLNLFDEGNLELKLVSSTSSSVAHSSSSNNIINYQSVCTLDKVKSALERVEKDPNKKRSMLWKSSHSPPFSSSSYSLKGIHEDENYEQRFMLSPVAAGCPGCLSYVLIMKSNPKCPRCNSVVPMPISKKPKIDLNISI